ncbi:hypothetical protein FRB94_005131 [Tulasnella sp. JGI-2019a]|nr:hypothetical protein FRB94_005131 [Tulasnella sp. JGI-2019a]
MPPQVPNDAPPSLDARSPVLLVAGTQSTNNTAPLAPISSEKLPESSQHDVDRLDVQVVATTTVATQTEAAVAPTEQVVESFSTLRSEEEEKGDAEERLYEMGDEDESPFVDPVPISSQQETTSSAPAPLSPGLGSPEQEEPLIPLSDVQTMPHPDAPPLLPSAPHTGTRREITTTTTTTLVAPKNASRPTFSSLSGGGTPSPLHLPPSPTPGQLLEAVRLGRARGVWTLAPFAHPPSSPSPQKQQRDKRTRERSESPRIYPMDESSSLTPATKSLLVISRMSPTPGAGPSASKRQKRFATQSPNPPGSPPPQVEEATNDVRRSHQLEEGHKQEKVQYSTTPSPSPPAGLFPLPETQTPASEKDELYSQDGHSPSNSDGEGGMDDELASQAGLDDKAANDLLNSQNDSDDFAQNNFIDDYLEIDKLGFQTQAPVPSEEGVSFEDS